MMNFKMSFLTWRIAVTFLCLSTLFQTLLAQVSCSLVRLKSKASPTSQRRDTSICAGSSLTLSADLPLVRNTSSYTVEPIPFIDSIPCETGGILSAWGLTADDKASPVFPIGFDFFYFGVKYTQFVLSPNGFMTFNTAHANYDYSSYVPTALPFASSTASRPFNSIFGAWMDIDIVQTKGGTGSISYQTVGVAPFRALIIKYDNCSYFNHSCKQYRLNLKMVLYETTNIIDMYIGTKPIPSHPICSANHDLTHSTQGIIGNNSTQFAFTPGRNDQVWDGFQTAYRYTPSGATQTNSFSWRGLNNAVLSNAVNYPITPSVGTNQFVSSFVFQDLNNQNITVRDTATVVVKPNVFNYIYANDSFICNSNVTLDAGPGPADVRYLWSNGATTRTINTNVPGRYYALKFKDFVNCINDSFVFDLRRIIKVKLDTVLRNGCFNAKKTGQITIVGSGNQGPMRYSLDGVNFVTTNTFNNIGYGKHYIYLTDNLGCITKDSVFLDSIRCQPVLTLPSCHNFTDGVISIQNVVAESPLFALNSSAFNNNTEFSNLAPNNYAIHIKDRYNCQVTQTVTLSNPNRISFNLKADTTTCNESNDGRITLNPNFGTPPYSYQLNTQPFQPISQYSNLSRGTYQVKVADSKGCQVDTSVSISSYPVLGWNKTVDSITCFNASNGRLVYNAFGGLPPYTYQYPNTTLVSNIINNVGSGIQIVTIIDKKGCSKKDTVQLLNPPKLTLSIDSVKHLTCFNSNDGFLKVSVINQNGAVTYNWTPSLSNNQVLSNLSAGVYKIVATDNKNCKDSLSQTITQPNELLPVLHVKNITCHSYTDGMIKINATGGTAPYVYSLNNASFGLLDSFNNLSIGTYPYQIRDSRNCLFSSSLTLTQPQPLIATLVQDSVSCHSGSDGSITVNAQGGTQPYRYKLFSNATYQSAPILMNLTAQNYTVEVKDTNQCVFLANQEVLSYSPIQITHSVDSVDCYLGSNGKITLSVSGGNAPYEYRLNNLPWQNSPIFSGLTPGSYQIQVKDKNQCVKNGDLVVINPRDSTSYSVSVRNLKCFNDAKGFIKVSVTSQVPPYQISFLNTAFQNLDSFESLSAGVYPISIKNGRNCIQNLSVSVTQPNILRFNLKLDSVACFGESTGIISVLPSGGTGSIVTSLDNSAFMNTNVYQNLASKTYQLSLRDANQCRRDTSFHLHQYPQLLAILKLDSVQCFNGFGRVEAQTSGGLFPYRYSLNGNANQFNNFYNGLTSGTYSLQITDAKNCVKSYGFNLLNPDELKLEKVAHQDILCFGDANAWIKVKFSGGVPGYSLSWSHNSSSDSIFNLIAGTYRAILTDAKNCKDTLTQIITQPQRLQVSMNKIDVRCFGERNGSINARISGGTSPYTFNWSHGDTSLNLNNLRSDLYEIKVTDKNLCSVKESVFIREPLNLSYNTSVRASNCLSSSNGEIRINQLVGGTQPVTYQWRDIPNSVPLRRNLLGLNTYYLNIIDANNCIKSDSFFVDTLYRFSASFSYDTPRCPESRTVVTIRPNTNSSPFVVNQNGSLSYSLVTAPLVNNMYTYTVTDSANCSYSQTLDLTVKDSMNLDLAINKPTCSNAEEWYMKAIVIGGQKPYRYNWFAANEILGDSAVYQKRGRFNVQVTDSNNCKIGKSFELYNPSLLFTAQFDSIKLPSCHNYEDGYLSVKAVGGQAPFSYLWDNDLELPYRTGLKANQRYSVLITDRNGCETSISTTLSQPRPIGLHATTQDAICFGDQNGIIKVQGFGGTPNRNGQYFFRINSSEVNTRGSFTGLPQGVYQVGVSDINNCKADTTVEIASLPEITIDLPSDFKTTIDTPVILTPKISTDITDWQEKATFLWTPSQNLSCSECLETQYQGFEDADLSFIFTYRGCQLVKKTSVDFYHDAESSVYIPNSFSPNQDQKNPTFRAYSNHVLEMTLKVFDRLGTLLFYSQNIEDGWDGTYKSEPMPAGTYYYQVEMTLVNSTVVNRSGVLNLFR